jgi:hypothetical protein
MMAGLLHQGTKENRNMLFLRQTLLIQSSASGMVFNTGLASWARIFVLLIAVGFFVFTLSSEHAYDPRFRVAVIVLATFLCVVVGPRTEVLIIQSERRLRIEKRFFIFSRAKEYDLNGSEEIGAQGKKIFLKVNGIVHYIAESGNEGERAAWLAGIQACLDRMREDG